MAKMESGLVAFAERELYLLLGRCKDEGIEEQKKINENILEIVKAFAAQGHSEGSADYTSAILDRLLRYRPLTRLTGGEDEWVSVGDGVFQNKRRGSVFKARDRFDGQPYDINAKIFSDDGGKTWFTTRNSAAVITFPYMPGEPERVYLEPKKE
jgi:hypothetical protein